MPIHVKDAGTWKQGNVGAFLYARTSPLYGEAGPLVWYPVTLVWLRKGGSWTPVTDYTSTPGAPSNLHITSAATDFTNVTLAWNAPTTGAPAVSYRVVLLDAAGNRVRNNLGLVIEYTTSATTLSFGIVWDTKYQFLVYATSQANIDSLTPSNTVKYQIGHPQQTREDPVYGWSAPGQVLPTVDYASSVGVFGGTTYQAAYAADNNTGTAWISDTRTNFAYFEALRLSIPGGGYRRVYSVTISQNLSTRSWLGMAQDLNAGGGWYWPSGGDYPASQAIFWQGATNQAYFKHPYLMWTPNNWAAGVNYEFIIDNANPAYVFSADRCTIDLAVDMLQTVGGGLRGGYNEIFVKLQDWVIVSYNTVVTATQLNNSYW